MSASDVLAQFGTRRLAAFVAALTLFLALHLARMPLLLAARLLEACMARVDHWVTASVTVPTSSPGPGEDIRQEHHDNAHQGRGSHHHTHHTSTPARSPGPAATPGSNDHRVGAPNHTTTAAHDTPRAWSREVTG